MEQHINRVSDSQSHPEDTEITQVNTAFEYDVFNIIEPFTGKSSLLSVYG